MGASPICPSAKVLVEAITKKNEEAGQVAYEMCQAHASAVFWVMKSSPTRERSLSVTSLEQALMWGLKGLADAVLVEE